MSAPPFNQGGILLLDSLGVRILRYPQWKHIWIGKVTFCGCFVQCIILIHWQELSVQASQTIQINVVPNKMLLPFIIKQKWMVSAMRISLIVGSGILWTILLYFGCLFIFEDCLDKHAEIGIMLFFAGALFIVCPNCNYTSRLQ